MFDVLASVLSNHINELRHIMQNLKSLKYRSLANTVLFAVNKDVFIFAYFKIKVERMILLENIAGSEDTSLFE